MTASAHPQPAALTAQREQAIRASVAVWRQAVDDWRAGQAVGPAPDGPIGDTALLLAEIDRQRAEAAEMDRVVANAARDVRAAEEARGAAEDELAELRKQEPALAFLSVWPATLRDAAESLWRSEPSASALSDDDAYRAGWSAAMALAAGNVRSLAEHAEQLPVTLASQLAARPSWPAAADIVTRFCPDHGHHGPALERCCCEAADRLKHEGGGDRG